MDTTSNPVNRVLDLLETTSAPWEASVEDMGRAVRDHMETTIQRELLSLRGQILAQVATNIQKMIDEAVKPLKTEIEDLKKQIETLPAVMRATLENMPSVVVNTPRRKVQKSISYDEQSRPIVITETEIMEKDNAKD